jgi:hypothetical protein
MDIELHCTFRLTEDLDQLEVPQEWALDPLLLNNLILVAHKLTKMLWLTMMNIKVCSNKNSFNSKIIKFSKINLTIII